MVQGWVVNPVCPEMVLALLRETGVGSKHVTL